jgi:hypothetical protein
MYTGVWILFNFMLYKHFLKNIIHLSVMCCVENMLSLFRHFSTVVELQQFNFMKKMTRAGIAAMQT